jgi:hypothetical protein
MTVIPVGSFQEPGGGGGGGTVTVTDALPVMPSLVAVIWIVPAVTAVTRPLELTEAIPAFALDQVMTRPVSTLLFASRVVAESWTVEPTTRLGAEGETDTVATGTGAGAVTVIAVVPVFVSLVAVIVALPAATAVTKPLALTEAMAGLELDHVTTRPVSTLPLASRVVAESCTVAPTTRLDDVGATVTDATGTGAGALTVIADEPTCPSLDAVTDTLPAATAVTSPEVETVAIPVFAELHAITRPVSTLPLASRVTAANWVDAPTCKLAFGGDTDTDATGIGAGALTLRLEALVLPSLVAWIIALPAAFAATMPPASTVATVVFELDQETTLPESRFPLESVNVAVAVAVCPTTTAEGVTATATVATGFGGGGSTAIVAWPETPSLTALRTAVPGATAEIMPESVTLATDPLDVNQLMRRFVSTAPFESLVIATPRVLCPAVSVEGRVTETDATWAGDLLTSTTDVPSYEEHAATLTTKPVTARIKARIDMRPPW